MRKGHKNRGITLFLYPNFAPNDGIHDILALYLQRYERQVEPSDAPDPPSQGRFKQSNVRFFWNTPKLMHMQRKVSVCKRHRRWMSTGALYFLMNPQKKSKTLSPKSRQNHRKSIKKYNNMCSFWNKKTYKTTQKLKKCKKAFTILTLLNLFGQKCRLLKKIFANRNFWARKNGVCSESPLQTKFFFRAKHFACSRTSWQALFFFHLELALLTTFFASGFAFYHGNFIFFSIFSRSWRHFSD